MILRCVLAVLVLAAPAPPSTTKPEVRTVPSSIDATGGTDVTGPLSLFLAQVPDGSEIALPRGANYRVEGTLRLVNRHNLVLDGRGSRIFATSRGARDRSQLSIDGGSGIVIRGLVIKGASPDAGAREVAYHPEVAFQHGIRILGAQDVEIDQVEVTDVFGDLVYIGPSTDGTWSERIWVHDSRLARNGRQGIAVTAGRDVVIEHNVISDTRRATIDLEPDTPRFGVQNVHVIDNLIGPGWLRFVATHGNGPVNQVVIARNELHGRDLAVDIAAPDGERRSDFYVEDNTSDKVAGGAPFRLTRLDGVVVRGNTQLVAVTRSAILATDVCGLQAEGNTFPGARALVGLVGAPCAQPTAGPMPPPPSIPGRDANAASTAPGPTEATPTTTAPGRAAQEPTTPVSTSSGRPTEAIVGAALAVIGAIALFVLWLDYRRRSERGSSRRR